MTGMAAARGPVALGGKLAGAAYEGTPLRFGLWLSAAALACITGAGLAQVQQERVKADSALAAAEAKARAESERASKAEAKLKDAEGRLEELDQHGALQELADYKLAKELGLARAFGHAASALPPDDQRRLLATIVRESRRNGLDPLLVTAVIQIESRFDPYAVSHVGARGLMQLMPPTAEWLHGDKLAPAKLFDAELNVELGTQYLAQLLQRFDGDLDRALIAYNAGPTVARQLQKGSKAWKRLAGYSNAIKSVWADLSADQGRLVASK